MVSRLIADYMRQGSVKGAFASGGVTGALTGMLEEGLFPQIYDVQSFDDEAALSLKRNPNHIEMSAAEYGNPDRPDAVANRLDLMILSATEIDREFNVNSLTGTDGRILGALGGAPDTAEGADLTMIVMPSMRGRIPTVHTRVDTLCTPGRFVDLLVTERGICVNPGRRDLERRLRDAGMETIPIDDLRDRVYRITGVPQSIKKGSSAVGVVESRRGETLDRIFTVGADTL
jgi:citrate lyase subunit alpha/citrate CoA-transferase